MTEGKDADTGRFLPGNRFWEARSSHGRNPKFATAEDLWSACLEYFDWVDNNPLHECKAFAYEGVVKKEALPLMRAMTIGALCLFLDIDEKTWRGWRTEGSDIYRPDLLPIITRAEQVIYQQKFGGASAGLLNANIIARDLGLADKSEFSGPGGKPIETKEVSSLEIARRVAFALRLGIEE